MGRTATICFAFLFTIGCSGKATLVPATDVSRLPLPPANYEILDWVTVKACASYQFFFFRTPEVEGNRAGYISRGSIIGGTLSDPESMDALYMATEALPSATHLLNPRFKVEFNGIGLFGLPLFGRRCSTVKVRGIAVGNGPFQPGSLPPSTPAQSSSEDQTPTAPGSSKPGAGDFR